MSPTVLFGLNATATLPRANQWCVSFFGVSVLQESISVIHLTVSGFPTPSAIPLQSRRL